MRAYVTEFIGTFFLVLAIGLTGNPIAIGAMLMVMVYLGAHVSGAHYNPAVTLAAWIRGSVKSRDVLGYFLFQILGGLAAAFVVYMLQGSAFALLPGEGVGLGNALFVELILTFVLASVILTVATAKKLKGNYIYGLVIGTTLMAIAFAGGSISGGAYNPAVGLGFLIIDTLFGGTSIVFLPLYIIGPLLGGAVAAWVFKYLNPKG